MAIGTVAAIGLGLAAAGTAGVLVNQRRGIKQQERALAYQKQQDALQLNLQRREQARAARVANANSRIASASAGVTDSSGAQGGAGSILSQYGANLGFSTQMSLISDQISTALGKASIANSRAQMFGGIAQLGMTIAANAPAPNKAPTTTDNRSKSSGGPHTVPF